MMKKCRTCERHLAISEFWANRLAKDGIQSECKKCMRARNQRWHATHREQVRNRQREATRKHRRLNPISLLLRSVRWRAKAQGIVCTLTLDDMVIPEFCPVLGMRLTFGFGLGEGKRNGAADSRASVDRIDSSKGYTPDNIVIVSWRANRIKSDATSAELMAIARFYRDLERDRSTQRQGHTAKQLPNRGASDDLSAMLRGPTEETRSMLGGAN